MDGESEARGANGSEDAGAGTAEDADVALLDDGDVTGGFVQEGWVMVAL